MQKRSGIISGSSGKPISFDIRSAPECDEGLIIFCHGFKGFKDWGHFPLVCETLAQHGFIVASFNFSHNGTTPEHPEAFVDLEAFGNNNYSKELDDLGMVMDHLLKTDVLETIVDPKKVFLLGHSRGGAIALLKAAEDARIQKVVGWACMADSAKRVNPINVDEWKEKGVIYIENARTGQQMPMYYQFREDFLQHSTRLDLQQVAPLIQQPVLLLHAADDLAVSTEETQHLCELLRNVDLISFQKGGHTFGGKHPWHDHHLPTATQVAVMQTIAFLQQ